jgi:hypothetical protein
MNLIFFEHICAVFFAFGALVCVILGENRGNHAKRTNAHVVFFLFLFISILYWANIYNDITIAVPRYDLGHVHLLRFIVFCVIVTTFTSISTHIIKRDALDLLLYVMVSIILSAFLFLSAISEHSKARVFWLTASLVTAISFYTHCAYQVSGDYVRSPKLSISVLACVIAYVMFFFFLIIMSPYHQNIISFTVVDIVMMLMDCTVSFLCGTLIIHYSWSITIRQKYGTQPNDITNYIENSANSALTKEAIIESYHSKK